MKRNQLQRELNRIKTRTPRLFWTGCDTCGEEFKHEPMFYFKYSIGNPMTTHTLKMWSCMKCCPTAVDVILRNKTYFSEGVDYSSLTPTHGEI